MTDPLPPSVWIRDAVNRTRVWTCPGKVCRACGAPVRPEAWSCGACLAPWHADPDVAGVFDETTWRATAVIPREDNDLLSDEDIRRLLGKYRACRSPREVLAVRACLDAALRGLGITHVYRLTRRAA